MGLFNDYVKRIRIIQGKKIIVLITAKGLQKYIQESIKQSEMLLRSDRAIHSVKLGADYRLRFYREKSEREIWQEILELLYNTFFRVIEEHIQSIQFNVLLVYIKIDKLDKRGELIRKISRDNLAFFKLDISHLLNSLCVSYFRNTTNIEQIFDYLEPYKFVTHEFAAHYLDLPKIKEGTNVLNRIKQFFGDRYYTQISVFQKLLELRVEGIAMFLENKGELYLTYDYKEVENARKGIKDLESFSSTELNQYKLGLYMYYFIALAFLFRNDRNLFNGLRVYYGKDDFLFMVEGLNFLLKNMEKKGVKIILMQNLPENLILQVFNTLRQFSHIQFLKEYEQACEILDIPKEHTILTLSDYKRLKKAAYDDWLLEVQKRGFSTKGIKSE